jgi:uncharacterized membrane protein YeaQ/YmgE (transglycosylase-associated protein family)
MNLIIWLVVGGLLGSIANMILRTDAQQDVQLNVAAGVIGALFAGVLITPLVGGVTFNQGGDFSLAGLVVSLMGAVLLLAVVNLFRRGRTRQHWMP